MKRFLRLDLRERIINLVLVKDEGADDENAGGLYTGGITVMSGKGAIVKLSSVAYFLLGKAWIYLLLDMARIYQNELCSIGSRQPI